MKSTDTPPGPSPGSVWRDTSDYPVIRIKRLNFDGEWVVEEEYTVAEPEVRQSMSYKILANSRRFQQSVRSILWSVAKEIRPPLQTLNDFLRRKR